MFTETDLYSQDGARDIVRKIVASIDKAVFALLGMVYQLFFSIASADVFSSEMISKFFSRVQLIIGVFVLFQLAMTILRGIVNPDGFMDSKSGAGNIIMRICTALVMLALIVPINIPTASNEYEKQINNNGLLFGTLYSLQHRILTNNTIGKVIMGVGDSNSETNYMTSGDNASYKEASNVFVSTIVKAFYRFNLVTEEERKHEAGKEDDQINDNRVCKDIDSDIINEYKKTNANPGTIIDLINVTCEPDFSVWNHIPIVKNTSASTKKYAFVFMPVVSSIIGIIFVLILLSFCVEVAMRAIKLAVLRLLAPIPIISYMDPKGGKDGAFGAWTKALTSTYLDLFIRVASVYFIIYIIQEMLIHGISTSSTGTLKAFTVLFIWIGLFYFAKEAPKFIKQILGIKDDGGGGLFSGLGKIAGLGAAAVGTAGAFNASRNASREADIQKLMSQGMSREDAEAKVRGNMANRAKHLVAGITGGALGAAAGLGAAVGAKDHRGRAAFDAIAKRNAAAWSAGRNGGTFFGAVGSDIGQMITGQSAYDKMEADWKSREAVLKNDELALKADQEANKRRKDANAHRQNIISEVKSKTVDSTATTGSYGNIHDANYYQFHSAVEAAKTRGEGVTEEGGIQWFTYNGERIKYAELDVYDHEIQKANEDDFYTGVLEGRISNQTITDEVAAYQSESGKTIETQFGGDKGLKASTGAEGRAITAESSKLAERAEAISNKRAKISEEKMGLDAQSAEANAKRFRSGGK